MRHSLDTSRSGLGAFVARRTDPEATGNIDIRRYRVRINAVATAKGLWGRIFKYEKQSNDEELSVSKVVPSVNSALGMRTHMMNPISMPTCEVNAVAGDWDVGLLPGAFPIDNTLQVHELQGSVVDSFNVVSAEDAGTVPLPVQTAEEVQQLEAESASSVAADSSPSPDTDLSPETISSPETTVVPTVKHSLSLFPPTISKRPLSPDWVAAPSDARRSLDALFIESRPGSELCFDPLSQLVNSIDRFRFTTLLNSSVIDNVKGTRITVSMTSSNLLNIGWDMKRLLVIWSRITLNAPDVGVLRVVQPWAPVSREHVAKACGLMQRGLQAYRDWSDISARALIIAQKHNVISDEWWAMHHKRFKELDLLHKLDFDDVFAQVELIMEEYLGFEKEVAILRKPARPERMTDTRLPSSAQSVIHRTSPSLSRSQLPTPVSRPIFQPTTSPQAFYTGHSLPASRPITRDSKIHQESKPSPMAPGPSSPNSSLRDEERLIQAAPNVPNYLRPTKASLRASEPTASVPSYMRPTKTTQGAYTPPVKPVTKATPTLRSERLEFALHGERSKPVPTGVNACLMETRTSSLSAECAPAVPPESVKRLLPKDLPKLSKVNRSDSGHAPSVHTPHEVVVTPLHSAFASWNTSPSIYTSTTMPLEAGSADPSRFLPADSRGDAHDVDGHTKPDHKTVRAPTLPPIEPKSDARVEIALIQRSDESETAKQFDEIRAKMSEMKRKLMAINAKRRNTYSGAEAESNAAHEQTPAAVDEQVEAAGDGEQPQVTVDEQAEATKDDDDEPSIAVVEHAEANEDGDIDDDDDDEEVWYDALEFSVEDECP